MPNKWFSTLGFYTIPSCRNFASGENRSSSKRPWQENGTTILFCLQTQFTGNGWHPENLTRGFTKIGVDAVIVHAVWLYFRFNLSLREFEEALLQRGIDPIYEATPSWVGKFGPKLASHLRRRQPSDGSQTREGDAGISVAGRAAGPDLDISEIRNCFSRPARRRTTITNRYLKPETFDTWNLAAGLA